MGRWSITFVLTIIQIFFLFESEIIIYYDQLKNTFYRNKNYEKWWI